MHWGYSFKLCALLAVGFFIAHWLPFCWNASESVPYRLFYLTGSKNIKKGDYVVFSHAFHPKVVKQVVGVGGDSIDFKDKRLKVTSNGGLAWEGVVRRIDSKGHLVSPIRSQVIPHDTFFVAGSHEDSYDSRYQSFGLVESQAVISRALPLF